MAVLCTVAVIMHTEVQEFVAVEGVTSMARLRFSNHVHTAFLIAGLWSVPPSLLTLFLYVQ